MFYMNIRYITKKKKIVKSVDTDVLILLIYYYSEFIKSNATQEINLLMELGQGNKKRVISVSEIVGKLETKVCKCLPALHVLTVNMMRYHKCNV